MNETLSAPILPEFPPKAEFRKWLRSLPPDEVVAKAWGCCSCPLALWMLGATAFRSPYVVPDGIADESSWQPDAETPAQRLPVWANRFGNLIDLVGCKKPAVTAADCLRVLARTPRA